MAIEAPLPVQAEVIVKHLAGTSNSQISKDLGMARGTIAKILSEAEISNLVEQSKSILLGALPDSARTIAKAVRKKSSDAWELLDRTGVMPKSTEANAAVNLQMNFSDMPNAYAKNEGSVAAETDQSDAAATSILPNSR